MTDRIDSLFQGVLDEWAERDAAELQRRKTGWYADLVDELMWVTTASDLRSGLKSLGDIDADELGRTLTERLFRSAEEGRPQEHALLSLMIDAVRRENDAYFPAPPSTDDALVALTARASLMAQRAGLDNARQEFASGAFSKCVGSTRAIDDWLRAVPDEQAGYHSDHDLVELGLSAIELRAEALYQLGQYDRAAAAYTSLLSGTGVAAGNLVRWFSERSFRVSALGGLAAVARRREQPELAVELARRAVRLGVGWYGQADPASVNNLAMALLANGQPRLAEEQFRQALDLTGPTEASPFTAVGLADVTGSTDGADLAEPMYGAEFDLGVATHDWRRIGIYADRVASRLTSPTAGQLTLLEGAHDDLPSSMATTVGLRLALARVVGLVAHERLDEAIEVAHVAIAAGTAVEPSSPAVLRLRLEVAGALNTAASSEAASSNNSAARDQLAIVLDHVDELVDHTPLDDRKAEIYGEWTDAFGLAIALELDGAASAEPSGKEASGTAAAYILHDRAKASTFVSILRDTVARTHDGGSARELHERRAELRRVALDLQDSSEEIASIGEQTMATMDRLHAEITSLDAQLDAADNTRLMGRISTDPADLRDALHDGCVESTAVVSFFCDRTSVYGFVLRSDDPELHAYRAEIGRAELVALAADLQRQFNGSPSEGYPPILRTRPDRRTVENWSAVEQRLFPPSLVLDDAQHVVFVPHGPLHALPLHAMQHGNDVLAATHSTSYLPNLSALSMILQRGEDEQAPLESRTAIVSGVAGDTDRHPEYFEADAGLFGPEWEVQASAGLSATRDTVLADLGADVDVIHLSCHGVFAPSRIGRSGLLLADGAARPPLSEQALTPIRRRRHLVSFQDAMRRDIRARLVTLRACSSGLQRPRNRGDEFESLTRTLLSGGARATLSALWNVDQESSMDLLAHFYRAWSHGDLTLGQALAVAQRETASSPPAFMAHHYHWAPFALGGDWRQTCPTPLTSTDSNRDR